MTSPIPNVSSLAPTPPAAQPGSFVARRHGSSPRSLRPRNAQVTTERALRRPAPASSDPNVRSVPSESSSGSRQRIPPPANHSYQALLRSRSAGPAPDDAVTMFPLSSLKATAAACPDGLQPAAPRAAL